jgi:prepilin-type N-terminal cleavage/methylation domain-containing protein
MGEGRVILRQDRAAGRGRNQGGPHALRNRAGSLRGFTLIEVILTVVLVTVVASMVGRYSYISTAQSAAESLAFRNELALKNALEDLTIEYKARIKAGTLTLPAMVAYANANHAALVDAGRTGYITLDDSDADGVYEPSAIGAYAAGTALLVTLERGDQSLSALFTE